MLFQEIGQATGVAVTLASLGVIALRQQQYEDAYRSYQQALGFARDSHSMPIVLQVLLGIARVLADPGGAALWPAGAPELPLLLAFIAQHPAATSELRDHARALLVERATAMPPDQITMLHQQASALDLAQVADIVAELAPNFSRNA